MASCVHKRYGCLSPSSLSRRGADRIGPAAHGAGRRHRFLPGTGRPGDRRGRARHRWNRHFARYFGRSRGLAPGRHHDLERADRVRSAAAVRWPEAGRPRGRRPADPERGHARRQPLQRLAGGRRRARLLALDAEIEIAGPAGSRRLPLRQFITGVRRTALAPGELVVAIHVPRPGHAARSALPEARRAALSGDLHRHGGRDRGNRRRPCRFARGSRSAPARRWPSGCPRSRRRWSGAPLDAALPSGSRPRTWRRCRRSTTCAAARPIAATPSSPCCAACWTASRHEGGLHPERPGTAAWHGPPVTRLAPGVARRSRSHRHQGRLRCRRLRRLHGAARRTRRSAPAWSPMGQVEGRAIETVEGLATAPAASRRCKHAFLAHGAAQCGICTPGMLMAAERTPAPRRRRPAAPRSRMRSAACSAAAPATARSSRRCSMSAAAPAPVAPAAGAAVGAAHRSGSTACPRSPAATSSAPMPCPADALWLARRPLAACAGALRARRPGAVCAQPRLAAVLTAADVPLQRLRHLSGASRTSRCWPTATCAFAARRCWRWSASAPRSDAIARRGGADRLGRPSRRVFGIDAATAPDAPLLHADKPDNVLTRRRRAARRCRRRLRGRRRTWPRAMFETGFVEHAYIEPEAGWARRVGDRIEIHRLHPGALHGPRRDRAACCGSRREAVRIVPDRLRRRLRRQARPLGAAAARASPPGCSSRPVRCVYTRPESMASTHQAPSRAHHARRFGCDARGQAHWPAISTATSIPAPMPRGGRRSPTACRCMPSGPIACRNVRALGARVLHQRPAGRRLPRLRRAAGGDRARGADGRAGRALGIDRLEFRHRNALRAGDATATGQVLDALGRPRRMPRGAAAALAEARDGEVAAFNARRAARGAAASASPACGTASAIPRCPTPRRMRIGLAPAGHADALQRRGRYRPGLATPS